MQYIKEGGALFSTHDQFDETHSRFIFQEELDMLQLLGFRQVDSHGTSGSAAYFDKTAISNTFFLSKLSMQNPVMGLAISDAIANPPANTPA